MGDSNLAPERPTKNLFDDSLRTVLLLSAGYRIGETTRYKLSWEPVYSELGYLKAMMCALELFVVLNAQRCSGDARR